LATGQAKGNLEGHSKRVDSLAYSPDGQLLASAGLDGRVIVWEPAARKRKLQEWQLPGPVTQVTFAADGGHLATTNANGTVYILRLTASSGK
jgi:WD40 repeat protein